MKKSICKLNILNKNNRIYQEENFKEFIGEVLPVIMEINGPMIGEAVIESIKGNDVIAEITLNDGMNDIINSLDLTFVVNGIGEVYKNMIINYCPKEVNLIRKKDNAFE